MSSLTEKLVGPVPTNCTICYTYTYSNIINTHWFPNQILYSTYWHQNNMVFRKLGKKSKETVRDEWWSQFPSFNRICLSFQRKGPLIVFPNYIMCQSIQEQPTTTGNHRITGFWIIFFIERQNSNIIFLKELATVDILIVL